MPVGSDETPSSVAEPVALEDLIVTATKRPQPSRDLPQSIAVLDGNGLEDSGAFEMRDYLRRIPGVQLTEILPQLPRISIRGIQLDAGGNTPEATGMFNVLVPAGTVLWTDYHLEWNGIGYAAPVNLATSCGSANQPWTVSATVYDTHGTVDPSDDTVLAGPCNGGASGFKK